MKKVIFALSLVALTLTSCGTKKKIAALEAQNKECQDLLNSTTVKLNLCVSEKEASLFVYGAIALWYYRRGYWWKCL